jgi:putative DNA primase/helicase
LSIAKLKEAMLHRWLISAVAAAFEPRGVSAHGVLVLQGEQYLGKTKWFKSLVPAELGVIQDGLILRPDDRDSVKQAVSFWLVELGELDATFRKSDIAQLKAFLTRDRDTLRRAYAKLESHYARRTVFFASVNPRQFLHDPTGNRRYWTISCASIDHDHGLDMQQVWAEVYETAYRAGEGWLLTSNELSALNAHNKDYEVLDPIRERLLTRFDWQANDMLWRWMTATDIMLEIGFDRPTRADVTQCGQIVSELNGGKVRKSNGKRLSRVPPGINT